MLAPWVTGEGPGEIAPVTGGTRMGRAIALMDDLFFQMKIAETAKQLGVDFKVATTGEALLGLLDPPTRACYH